MVKQSRLTEYILAICGGLVLLLSGCRVGVNLPHADTVMPDRYVESWNGSADTLTMADYSWWEIYGDTALQAVIDATLRNNRDLAVARARIKELAAMKRVASAALLPSVSGQAYGQRETLNYGGDSHKGDPEFGLKATVSWEADLWGNLRYASDKSASELRAAIWSERALQMSLVAEAAKSYFELVALHTELAIVKSTLAARRESERIAKLRYEGGLTAETSYLQAKTETARTATYLPRLEQRIAAMENNISTIMGEYPSGIVHADRTADFNLPERLPVGMPSTLLRQRPDIRAEEERLKSAYAQVGVAYTDRFPRLTLTAIGGLENEELGHFLKSPMSFLSAGLLGPIFDWGKRQGAYRAAQAAYEGAVSRYEGVVINAFSEVRTAISNYTKVQESYDSWAALERDAKATMELAQVQYINGAVGYLNVLDAQRSYFDARVGLSNAMRDKQTALADLYLALGGGWSDNATSVDVKEEQAKQ
ncbi:efflux transporter outer membrane subunit [Muribaculum intestinale]|uniref:efflux transporter outer membrane subunit n=1 Tax=Muribaculum intestinale TaxID=1796646 RepID=UPI00272C8B5A|nr:efflux transporter outer membrane subunit [Muribaculum intestinale]